MERIEFKYTFTDEGENNMIVFTNSDKGGITSDTVCEMFIDFMRAAGYSEDAVTNYFLV